MTDMPTLNPLQHPICLSQPDRIAPSAWAGHIPFAMYLIDVLRPHVIVELGTFTGVSYCGFCQAVKQLDLPTRCYAIDTWRGDEHTGFYDQELLEELKRYHDPLYSSFSSLTQSTFAEALPLFADSSIDLLHIDGAHAFESVKQDFESWLPKMSARGIVLIHDICESQPGFGVGRLWSEIKQRYRTFEFQHEHVLGVVATGDIHEPELQSLFALSEPDVALIRQFFHQLGKRLTLTYENAVSNTKATCAELARERDQLLTHARELDREIEIRDQAIDAISDQLDATQNRTAAILNSRSWRWVNRYALLKARVVQPARRALRRSSNGFGPVDDELDYRAWVKQHDLLSNTDRLNIAKRIQGLKSRPRISIVVLPCAHGDAFLERTIDSLRTQLYPNYEVCVIVSDTSRNPVSDFDSAGDRFRVLNCEPNEDPLGTANRALADVGGDFVGFVHAGDELPAHALYLFAEQLNRFSGVDIVYSDEDWIDAGGARLNPYFKPDWNPDLLHSGDFLSRLALYRTALLERTGRLRPEFGESALYDLSLRATEGLGGFRIRHLPYVLYHRRAAAFPGSRNGDEQARALQEHLDRLRMEASVTSSPSGFCRIQHRLPQPNPLVTLIIATRDRVDLLRQIVGDILAKTDYAPIELIIVDNVSREPATIEYLKELEKHPGVSILSHLGRFNFLAINNQAARAANGEVLGFLNNDLKIISSDWLREMVSQVLRPGVGAVGAKLYYPDDTIQHAGVILGLGNLAGYVHRYAPRDAAGHGGRLNRVQDCSAVTAACIVLKRSVFEEVGGFDEVNLPVAYNDVDLCLKIRERGYRVLWTPHAELYHLESASRPSDFSPDQKQRYERECAYFKFRWHHKVARDPFYNPNLTLAAEDYSLAWPPRAGKPWNA
ncbi:MAG: class I SAM-dependent methyltransferase [Pyrinomonadaceae bacterium]